jgi:hypothetical protein
VPSVQSVDKIVDGYVKAYQKLYQRSPTEVNILDQEWVVVNGARMRIGELEFLTGQLRQEYEQIAGSKRSVVSRLINWLKS